MEIIGFEPGLAKDFKDLNLAWLQKYFEVEPADEKVLYDPQGQVIDKGGFIFFAKSGNTVAGTVTLLKLNETVYELAKMAVEESFQGKKIGNRLLEYCIDFAKDLDIQKLVLYSNRKLLPALHLYKKFGFVEVPLGNTDYKRSDIKMEKFL
ncbi:MAG: GNAT family N-acetyltransferase [Chitinophagaceae bacterium]|nr:GNAT family N-acetyltransferase [Chitinophagaceae bacterium]